MNNRCVRGLATIEFPRRMIAAGGRISLASMLTTRGAVRFAALVVNGPAPEGLMNCVLERLVVGGVDQLDIKIGLRGGPMPRPDLRRAGMQLARVIALALQPIEIEVRSYHDKPQAIHAVIIGDDEPSPFPPCLERPVFVTQLAGVERLACTFHGSRGAATLLEDWIAIRRSAPAHIQNAGCGCLYWRPDDFPPMQ